MRKYYFVTLFLIFLDQGSKLFIRNNFVIGESQEVIPGLLYWTSHRNSGAAWGILEGRMSLFYILTIIFVGWIVYYMETRRVMSKMTLLSLSLLLGGALGNFIDRLLFKEVTDFIHVKLFDFPIFNLADSFLTIGVILMILDVILSERKGKGTN